MVNVLSAKGLKKIYLDAGHGEGTRNGRADSGAVNEKQGLIEAKINLRIVKYIQEYLEANYTGFEIMQTRTNSSFYTLGERSAKANEWGADIFVSCHVNAGGGTGYESFVYTKPSSAAVALQNVINAEAVATAKRYGLGTHGNQPSKRDNLSVLRRTAAPAVLTEICYLDSNDYKLLQNEQFVKDMSIAYAVGIAKFLGLKVKQGAPAPAPAPTPTPAPKPEPAPEVLPKVYSLGDKYAFQVEAREDIGVYKYSNISENQRTLKKGTVFSVYGYTEDTKAFAVPNGFVQAKDVTPLFKTIQTGGLNKDMENEFRTFLKKENIGAELDLNVTGNPDAEIKVAGLDLVKVKKFLDVKEWWYTEQ
jgi:N-acetylmuramoyl-L-alanine amidase